MFVVSLSSNLEKYEIQKALVHLPNFHVVLKLEKRIYGSSGS